MFPVATAARARRQIVDLLTSYRSRPAALVSSVSALCSTWSLPTIDAATFGFLDRAAGAADVVATAGSAAITSASNPWTSADVGKSIAIGGAGAAAAALAAVIVAVTAPGAATLDRTATTSQAATVAVWGYDPVELSASPLVQQDGDPAAALLFAAQGSSTHRTPAARAGEVVNVLDCGAIGDGVTDDTAAIQAAITKAAGRSIYFPPGVYITSGTITLSKNTKYIGSGKSIDVSKGSVIKYTGAGDAFADLNPIDTPTAANITIQDISFYYVTPTVAQKKCAIHLRGSTFVDFVNCGFYGGEYGVIADQAELVSFTRCDFESQSTGCLWLTNGADKTPTASEAFTNRITVSECQFNTASAIGVVDDGGLAHVYENNNFNACSTHIRLCGVEACVISGNELEVATSDSILTSATKYGGGSPAVSKCRGLNIVGNFIFQSAGGTGAINFAAASVETAIVTGNDVNTPAGVAVVAGAANAVSLTMFANFQRGAGTAANNYYEEGQWSPVVKFGGASVGIAGSFVGKYTKIGRIVYWNCTLAFTNKGSSVGDMTVAGLPYSAGTVATFPGSPGIVTNLAGATVVQPWVNESANVVTMQKGNLASTSNMADTDIQNNTRIDVAGWYIAA